MVGSAEGLRESALVGVDGILTEVMIAQWSADRWKWWEGEDPRQDQWASDGR